MTTLFVPHVINFRSLLTSEIDEERRSTAIASNEIIRQNRTDRLATQRRIELKSSIWCEFIRSQTVDVVLHTSESLSDSVFIDSPDNNLCFQNQLKTVDTQSDQFIEGQNMNKQTKTSSKDFTDRNERDICVLIILFVAHWTTSKHSTETVIMKKIKPASPYLVQTSIRRVSLANVAYCGRVFVGFGDTLPTVSNDEMMHAITRNKFTFDLRFLRGITEW